MSMSEMPPVTGLGREIADLRSAVGSLATELATSDAQRQSTLALAQRANRMSRIVLAVSAGVVILLITVVYLFFQVNGALSQAQEVAKENKQAAVVNCQNSNQWREASRALWGFIVRASISGDKKKSPREVEFLQELLVWINTIYGEHDCSDLAKKYTLPPPPRIPQGT